MWSKETVSFSIMTYGNIRIPKGFWEWIRWREVQPHPLSKAISWSTLCGIWQILRDSKLVNIIHISQISQAYELLVPKSVTLNDLEQHDDRRRELSLR